MGTNGRATEAAARPHPTLVEAVREYMQHECSTLEAVTEARAQALAAGGNVELGQLFAVVENYPKLRAVKGVPMLQEQITSTENGIAYARQFYNHQVMKYDTLQSTVPRHVFTRLLPMSATGDLDRANVPVQIEANGPDVFRK